jgi:putative ABC transport system permease protein
MTVGIWLLTGLKENLDTDHFHPKLDRIVRLLTQVRTAEQTTLWATVPQPVADKVRQVSGVESVVQVRHGGKVNVVWDKGEVPLEVMFTEPSFFDVFNFTLETGDAARLLTVLSQTLRAAQVNPADVLRGE